MSLEYEKDPGWQYLKRSREQQLADQSRPYDSKKNVWIPDPEEGYIEGEIKGPGPKADTVIVTAGGKDVTLKKDIVQEMNPPKFEKTEDMSNLTFLNDASVLWNLRSRYAAMLIYTYSGLFCVVINPYKRLPIYTDSVARMFMGKRRTEMPPHLFAVSDEAYRNMLQDHENQSMLITGESGAGKTENTKKVIAYFATVGASQKAQPKEGEKTVTLEDQIVQTNPVLEAFGNAKTVRNNNSSRFGKFIRIHFNKYGTLASCDIEHYLLEKSRVIRQAPGERCYHIFYQIFSDFKPQLRNELLLDKPIADYWFVAQAELLIDGIDDTEEFQLTDEAFDVLKFSETEKMDCYRLMSGHMHMGNMKFKQRPREEQAEPDGQDEAEKACAMFGVDADQFLKALVSPRVKVGTEWVSKGQNVDQVHWAIGAMAKGLYARVFNWLVKKYFVHRYAILAAKEAKSSDDPKTAAGAILQSLINAKKLNDEQFRIGHTKVFFKAGVVAHIEDLRDEKLNQIITGFQSAIRWYTATADAGARRKQLNSYIILQRNIRSWCVLRTWDWFLLFGKIRPQLKCGKMAEEMAKMAEEQKVLEVEAKKAEAARKAQEEAYAKLSAERSKLLEALELTQGGSAAIEEKLTRLNSARQEVEKSLNDANDRLSEHEEKNADLEKQRRKAQQEVENLKKSIEAVDGNLSRSLEEKAAKENQIRSLQDEMNSQDETIGKINKEKKHLEENNRQLIDDLQAEEAKQAQANRLRGKLEQTLDEMEEAVEREKRIRAETEKSKRKVEGELKGAQESIDELTAIKLEADASLKKKEADIHALGVRIEDEQALANRLTRQSKENAQRIIEIEDELEHERQSRSKADRARAELQRELDELNERLDEQNKQLEIQQENNKKKDSEIIKFRRDLDEKNMANEDQMAMIRRKNNDQIQDLTNTLDALQKGKAKIEKEKGVLQKELDDINAQVDQETKSRVEQERLAKQYEIQVAELQQKVDEQTRQITEFTSTKGRLSNDNSDLARQVEELEIHLATINRAKTAFSSQLVEAKKAAEDELHERQEFHAACKNLEHELDQCHELLEEQINGKDDIQRQLSRINSEISQWKARYEGEGLVGSEELEELKRKQMNRVMDLQEALSAAQNKVISLEKAKGKLLAETEDARSDVDRHLTVIASLEKKQRAFDKIVDDWKRKVDDIQKEIDATTRDSRNTSTEVFKLRSSMDNLSEQIETLRRENKIYSQEIRDINEQITQGGRTYQEVHKSVRRLEQEKDELQHALDEAEAALEAEESKVLRLQIEVQQIRSEIEKRIQEKEEEFENTRKNHQRALESIQASLETEAKSKAELARAKKKLETDINQLEIALDHANKANVDAQKNLKKLFDQVKELQGQVDDEQRRREEIRENYLAAEKRLAVALSESEDLAHRIDASEKHKKQLEIEQAELKSSNTELIGNNAALSAMKRKVENEVQIARNELDEYLNELKASEERARKAAADADRLAEEVRQEQEHAVHVDRQRKSLELNAKELQAKIDDAERAMIQFGAKALSKVEERVRSVEAELHSEQRRHQEAVKGFTKQERRARELQFQVEEDKKAFDRLQENVEKLQQKIRVQKRQIEEAEEVATQNLSKFRQIQLALENAEERAEVAENSLVRMRGQVVRSATANCSAAPIYTQLLIVLTIRVPTSSKSLILNSLNPRRSTRRLAFGNSEST
ncbi:hypothetical protein L5515_001241 [Caenorhabditis briggsae]|uniref:Uncharacterized protein n=1 Tax=Caenorhabditis briggsae TaxID=6238 RepID=A0AAE9E4B5_CAEBR|nr:hypothetical protein L5515_001241 [Caenorhabditis briggsae]